MYARNTRSRKAIETLSQAINETTLKDLHAMLLSVKQRLDWNVWQQLKKVLKTLTTRYLN